MTLRPHPPTLFAQDPPATPPAAFDEDTDSDKPTDVGIRFTPQIAHAMSGKFIEGMKSKYDLDDAQSEDIRKIMEKRLMKFARDNAESGRDMIELMMATMIANDGRFPKDEAQRFAKMAQPFIPRLREFFTESSAEIGKQMNMKQRLKFTGDMTLAATGLSVFESRMKRWEEGKIGDFANPFFDPADKDPAKAEPARKDPNEHADMRRARVEAEFSDWEIKLDEQWEGYVTRAIEYYGLDDKQSTAARAILKDCQDRAAAVRTTAWTESVKQNRLARRLTRIASEKFREGPWIYSLDREYKKLRQPLIDLEEELKRRLEDLPTSAQRATAKEEVRKVLAARGLKQLPT